MKLELLNKRVDKATEAYRADAKARLKSEAKRKQPDTYLMARQAAVILNGSPFCGKYSKRAGRFYSKNWEINLVEETGHSYEWWSMFKRINGHLVLNTFSYSNSTCAHIANAGANLRTLGIRYLEVESPEGLQDMQGAVHHTLNMLARAQVKLKYARKPCRYDQQKVGYWEKKLLTLRKLGYCYIAMALQGQVFTMAKATELAEVARRAKLDDAKAKRQARKERE